jgi:hypothetical protein
MMVLMRTDSDSKQITTHVDRDDSGVALGSKSVLSSSTFRAKG